MISNYPKKSEREDPSLDKKKHRVVKIIQVLGSGSCGEACLVRTRDGNLRVMKKSFDNQPSSLEHQFIHMKMARAISDEFIEPLYFGTHKKEPCFIMEYMEGHIPLDRFFKSQIPLDRTNREKLVRQLFRMVRLLHDHGIVHKDIKPSNIMIHPLQCDLRLIDFGFAQSDRSKRRNFSGTYIYSGPHVFAKCVFDRDGNRAGCGKFTFDEFAQNDMWGAAMVGSMILAPSYENIFFVHVKNTRPFKQLQYKLYRLFRDKKITTIGLINKMIESVQPFSDFIPDFLKIYQLIN